MMVVPAERGDERRLSERVSMMPRVVGVRASRVSRVSSVSMLVGMAMASGGGMGRGVEVVGADEGATDEDEPKKPR